jgi:hypothetical protein
MMKETIWSWYDNKGIDIRIHPVSCVFAQPKGTKRRSPTRS